MLGRLELGVLLDLAPLGERERLGRPPEYFGYRESKPSVLRLWITFRTRSSLVEVTSAMFAAGMPCADSSTIWAAARSPLTRFLCG